MKNRERNIDMQSENQTDELKKESEIEADRQIDRQTDEGTGRQMIIVRDSQMKRKQREDYRERNKEAGGWWERRRKDGISKENIEKNEERERKSEVDRTMISGKSITQNKINLIY